MTLLLLVLCLVAIASSIPVNLNDNVSSSFSSSTYECQCSPLTSWNDVIFLFSTSSSMGRTALIAAQNMMVGQMSEFNVQKTFYSNPRFTRVGVMGYGAETTIISPLGTIDGGQLANINIPYTGDATTNLESAIKNASTELSGQQFDGRASSRPVIFIYSSTYNPGGVTSPTFAANQFKDDGGIIVVYDFITPNGVSDPTMKQLASPGYYIDSRNAPTNSVTQALCDANCFCPPNIPSLSETPRKAPIGGCYVDLSGAPSSYPRSSTATCPKIGANGVVSMDKTNAVTSFLNELTGGNQIWNGLMYDINQRVYKWADGSILDNTYAPWYSTPSIPPPGSNYCVRIVNSGFNTQWIQSDCTFSVNFVCQTSPCDSTRYCEADS